MNKTPKLRFKEFSGDWESKKLGELGEFKNGVNKSKEDFGHGYPFINLMDVFGKNSIKNGHYELVNATDKELNESNLIKGDVLFIRSSVKPSGVGMTAVILEDLKNTVYSGFLIRFRDNGCFDLNFKKYCFYNERFRNELISKSSTSANTNINQENLKLLNINIPSKEEQEKIASFFSLIDDKISLQVEKVEVLKDYKKGMMQKIFSRELRFKDEDGRDYPEWEEKKLGDIASICTGKKDTQDKIDNGVYPFFVRSQTIERINSYSYDGEAILTAGDGVGVGKVFHYINGKFDYHQRVYKICDFNENTYGRYIYEYFRVNFIREVTKYTAKTSVDSVRMEMITKMKIPYPVLDEQIKIANVLKNIDLKIDKEQEKLDSLNEYKKGLLQQMFV